MYIIAEVGCNHMGDIDIACKMIRVAADFCNVNAVKFQKRTPKELLSKEQYNAPHPVEHNSYGDSYGKHREFLEFSLDEHKLLKEVCESAGVAYSASVWDLTAAKEIVSLKPDFIKVGSPTNTNSNLLVYLCTNYPGEIHVSLGMTTRREEHTIFDIFHHAKRLDDLVLYACTSDYPVEMEDICLYEITRLQETYGTLIKGVGFSGHHKGIAPDVAALTLGAEYLERHFTLDRTWKGTDHAASLEPGLLRKLARDMDNVGKALTYKSEEVLPVELPQRKKLKNV